MSKKIKKNITINDLRELDFAGRELTPQQRLAIKNFERYRFTVLSSIKSEGKFHTEFQRIQVMANLSNFEEFLESKYLS